MDPDAQGKENLHIMHVPTSPSFLKPKPIKLRKKTTRTKTPLPLNEVNINRHAECISLVKSPKTACNPFRRCSDAAKRKREPEDLETDSNSLLWKQVNRVLENPEPKLLKPSLCPVVPSMLDESALSSFSDTLSACIQTTKEKTIPQPIAKTLPVDWSLKTKVRFTSPVAFPSRGSFRTFEEVNGTIGFVRCLHPGETDKSSDLHSSHGAKFFQHCLVWMHPSLPWLNLFPRADRQSTKHGSSSFINPTVQEILHSKWCDSFRSLYQLVRLYQCPYFYMCTPSFTVLFRCAGAASIPVLHALIGPTTKGFRKALRDEGITFTMPLTQKQDSESSIDETDDELINLDLGDDGKSPDVEEEDEEPESWLESLGLSQENFPSLTKTKRRNELSYQIDHKPESLVYVEDSETQALVNFLLNSNFCTAKIGPMAGVPPTLLAPVAFLGGTLEPLKIRHGKVKQNNKELDSMEISGPLLPHTIHSLSSLFTQTQDGDFTVALTSHPPTTTFSLVQPQAPPLPCIFAKNNLTDCGLPETLLQQMCSEPGPPIHSVTVENGLFCWK